MERAVKKTRCYKPITFQRKVHREQYDFNKYVTECLQKAVDKITKRPTDATYQLMPSHSTKPRGHDKNKLEKAERSVERKAIKKRKATLRLTTRTFSKS